MINIKLTKTLFTTSVVVLLVISLHGNYHASTEVTLELDFVFPSPSSIIIDGIISPGEWDNAANITQWYMNADFENYDGFNYMYLAEDLTDVYVALDLISDQTNNTAEEWVSLFFNTNETVSNNLDDWENRLNAGMESLFFDVENDQTISFFDPNGYYNPGSNYVSIDQLQPIQGTFSGTEDDFDFTFDNKFANMTSVFNGTHYVYRMDLEIFIPDYYSIFEDLFINNTISVEVWTKLYNNVTIDNHYLSIRDKFGNLLLNDPDQTIGINLGVSNTEYTFDASNGNYTTDNKALFTFTGVSDVPFKTSFDLLRCEVRPTNLANLGPGAPNFPFSSIDDYEIAWEFAGSPNNATSHRMFEFKIPKSELEGYWGSTDLGVMFGGYGTLTSWPNTHHWVLANNTDTGIPHEYSTNYFYHSMPLKEMVSVNSVVLSDILPNPSETGDISLDWNDDANVVNWTLVRHTSEITSSNVLDVTVVATGLTQSQFVDTGLTNGTYWYGVVAQDENGYAYLSNSVSVVVVIPDQSTSTTTSSDSSTSSTPVTTTSDVTTSTTTSTSDSIVDSISDSIPGFTFVLSLIAIFAVKKMSKRD